MKRRVLRKWVTDFLIIVDVLIFFVLAGEFATFSLQCIFTLVGLLIAYMNAKIIKKWGNLKGVE